CWTWFAFVLALASPGRTAPRHELTVFAAASLREAFREIAKEFERSHPGTSVSLALAGSQELRTQIENGAPADVFASADSRHMEELAGKKLVVAPRIFARNEAVVVVPKGNPAGIGGLSDLPRATRVVVGTPEVPIGAYTQRILDAASLRYGADFRRRVEARVVSREVNVRQVLAKIALGEADAAIVYRTDAATSGAVQAIAIPPELNVVAQYPVALVSGAREPALAREFIELLLSPAGERTLVKFGFRPGSGA
ncbi:MAG TPA: molybdate ABC transporter substrate-binding protein, partial [Myxococcales bacterium]|nr:molybdate ABC transporter substrate-binding protein [Myxococcales bacterium]